MSTLGFLASGTTTLSVTDSTGNVAFAGAGDVCIVQNTGGSTVYVANPGDGNVAATVNDTPLLAGAVIVLKQGTATHLAAVCDAGGSSELKITSGSGDPGLNLLATVVTTSTEGKATAAAPSYSEGAFEPLSLNLSGDLRTAAKQSGTWTVQPGNTQNTTAWLVTGAGGTFPATQSGTWNVNAAQSGTWSVDAVQSGTWNIGTVTTLTGITDTVRTRPQSCTTGTITSVGDSASDTVILSSNSNRLGASIYNDSAAVLYLALANVVASTTTYSVQIAAGGYYELPANPVYTGVIKGVWSSAAGGAARVTEYTA